jgi:hypothetical protein
MSATTRFLFLNCCCLLAISAAGILGADPQTTSPAQDAIKQVLDRFMAFETNGGRLRASGWRKADQFFARPAEPPKKKRDVDVIYPDYGIDQIKIQDNTADVIVEYLPQGTLDSQLHFEISKNQKGGYLFHLVLVPTYAMPDPKGGPSTEVTGLPQWRIEKSSPTIILNLATAIRYTKDTSDQSSDPAVKKNAAATLALITKWR